MAGEKFDPQNIGGTDDLIRHLGSPGRLQTIVFVLAALNYFPCVFNHVSMAFYAYTPPYHCTPSHVPPMDVSANDNNTAESSVALNLTSYTPSHPDVNLTTDKDRGAEGRGLLLGRCEAVVAMGDGLNQSVKCGAGEFSYHLDRNEQTVVMEWDLVCGHAYLAHLATTVYYLGVMLGGFVCGYLSDYLGRRPVILGTLGGATVLGVALAFVTHFQLFLTIKFALGFLMQGLQVSSYIMAAELFPTEYRTLAACVMQLFWGASVLALGGLAWIFKDWRSIQLAISLPSLLAIPYLWVLPESLRWLLARNKKQKAERLIRRIAVFNKSDSPLRQYPSLATECFIQKNNNTDTDKYSNDRQQDSKQRDGKKDENKKDGGTVRDLFSSPVLLKRSLILFYVWFAGNVSYFGLTFMSTSLAGNRFVNYTLSGSVEFLAYVSNLFVIRRFGRRNPLCFYYCMAAVCCLAVGTIPATTASGTDLTKLIAAFGIFGKFAAGGSFTAFELLTVEMYPTVLRSVGTGLCGFWGRLGAVVAPQCITLGLYTFSQMPAILIGSMTLLGGGIVLLLPDTSHAYLPDTVYEITVEASDPSPQVAPTSVTHVTNPATHVTDPLLSPSENVSSV